MHIPSLPGPGDVRALAEQMLALAPRITGLLASAESLVADSRALIERIERTRADADALMRRTDETRIRAERAVTDIEIPVTRVIALLDRLEPSLTQLQPTLDRLAETTDPGEVDALVALVDQLPLLTAKVDTDVIPMLHALSTVAPDMHDLLDTSRELNELLGKLPGMGRIKKKVEEEQVQEHKGTAAWTPGPQAPSTPRT